MRGFQTYYGLTVDGIVGVNTWMQLRDELVYTRDSGTYHMYRTFNDPDNTDEYFRFNTTNSRWGIKNKDNAYWTSFTTNGPS